MQQLSIQTFTLFKKKPEKPYQTIYTKLGTQNQYMLYKNESLKIPRKIQYADDLLQNKQNSHTSPQDSKFSYSHSLKYLTYVPLIKTEDLEQFNQRATNLLKPKQIQQKQKDNAQKQNDSILTPEITENKPVSLKFSLKQVKSQKKINNELMKKLQGNTIQSPQQNEFPSLISPIGSGVFPQSIKRETLSKKELRKIYSSTDGWLSNKKQSEEILTPKEIKQTQGTNTPTPQFEIRLSKGQVFFQQGSAQQETWEDRFRFTKTHYKKLFKYIDVKPIFKL